MTTQLPTQEERLAEMPEGQVKMSAEATTILGKITLAQHELRFGRLSREAYFETVDDLGIEWRALFRRYALIGNIASEEETHGTNPV